MKKLNKYIAILFLLIAFGSCKDYLDINDNPNDATTSSAKLLLPAALSDIATRFTVDFNGAFSCWLGYWSYADGWSGWFDIKKYEITSSNFIGIFTTPYQNSLEDLTYIENTNQGTDGANYRAIAKILKVLIYQSLVDAYGYIPYSEANIDGITSPKYDKDQIIYEDLVSQLDSAQKIFTDNAANAQTVSNDILFGGNITSWEKFANTLKLKILLRQALITGRSTYIQNNLQGLAISDFLGTDALVNPGYTAAKPQPYYSTYGFTTTGGDATAHTQYVLNAYIEHVYDQLNDPRKIRTFNKSKSDNKWWGKPFGYEGNSSDNRYNSNNGNLIGGALIRKDTTNTYGSLIVGAFESYFLQAEAVQRGFLSGDVKDLYQKAVTASFQYLGLDTAKANAYLKQSNAGSNWDLASDKLSLILNQKYIAFTGINGFEAWTEYRRTGIPDPAAGTDYSLLSHYQGVSRLEIPSKLQYPQREFNYNNTNVLDAVKATYDGKAPDKDYHFDSKIFWDVN